MKFSIKPADLVTFTEEIRNGKLHFLCINYNFIEDFHHHILSHESMKQIGITCNVTPLLIPIDSDMPLKERETHCK